jgi:hypothetical protein
MEVEGVESDTYDVVLFGPSDQTTFARYRGGRPDASHQVRAPRFPQGAAHLSHIGRDLMVRDPPAHEGQIRVLRYDAGHYRTVHLHHSPHVALLGVVHLAIMLCMSMP